ncbi:MAG TPA: inverse autotransporter beta domain-containing protein, partial [Chroococcales cyanobacterium]
MKKPAQAFCVGLVFFGALTHPVVAQTSETDSSTPLPSSTGQAGDLKVLPRIGASFTTTGAGYEEPFFSLEGFVPLQQTPGSNLTFLEGRALVLTDSTFGTNLILGQRFYRPSQNIVLGGYLSYDVRDTGNTTFHQIGAGFEKLGDAWDFRINGYLPVGNTREQIAESISNPFFQQNFLILERSRQFQAAMAGFDMEAGGRLLRIGNGDLRGYAGMYYYSATGSEDALGVKGRLEARPNDNFRLGLSVQHDPLFDTSVVLSLGMNFPGSRPRGVQRGSALARMGESVGRTAT